jgi:hypothetical protein
LVRKSLVILSVAESKELLSCTRADDGFYSGGWKRLCFSGRIVVGTEECRSFDFTSLRYVSLRMTTLRSYELRWIALKIRGIVLTHGHESLSE